MLDDENDEFSPLFVDVFLSLESYLYVARMCKREWESSSEKMNMT